MPAQSRVDPLDEYKRTRRLCFKPQARTSVYAIEKSDNRRNETQNFTQALIIISHNAIQKGKTPGLVALSIFLFIFLERGGENGNGPTRQNHSVRFMATAAHSGLTQIFFFPSAGKKKNCLQLFPPPFFYLFF